MQEGLILDEATMRGASSLLGFAFFGLCIAQRKVVLTNDDGWAVAQIRSEYDALKAAGYDVGHVFKGLNEHDSYHFRSFCRHQQSTSRALDRRPPRRPPSPLPASLILVQRDHLLKDLTPQIVRAVLFHTA